MVPGDWSFMCILDAELVAPDDCTDMPTLCASDEVMPARLTVGAGE